MTRKQAISQAITALSQVPGNNETVEKLKELYDEMPLSYWTKQSIIDSIETYAMEHDNILPKKTELISVNNLPSITVINSKFKTSSLENFYNKYLSHLVKNPKNSSPYRDKDKTYFLDIFKENHIRIQNELQLKYVCARTYDKHRIPNTPNHWTIMDYCECKTYEELLIKSGYKRPHKPMSATLKVSFCDCNDLEIEKKYKYLEDIIKS